MRTLETAYDVRITCGRVLQRRPDLTPAITEVMHQYYADLRVDADAFTEESEANRAISTLYCSTNESSVT